MRPKHQCQDIKNSDRPRPIRKGQRELQEVGQLTSLPEKDKDFGQGKQKASNQKNLSQMAFVIGNRMQQRMLKRPWLRLFSNDLLHGMYADLNGNGKKQLVMPLWCKDLAANRNANSRLAKSTRFGKNEPTLYPAFTLSDYRICDSRHSPAALRSVIGISTVNQVIRPRRGTPILLRGGKHLSVPWQVNNSSKHTIGSQWEHSVPRALQTETNFQTNSELFNSNHTS
ncbi:hypothetical protein PoB_006660100 [Plakobranchus ocellatus]|uniref:Uncharacterized protein n=1 Tax=Plakobranchus ocellatus TaxID=259542 RepID=A0AAV4D819_9GAST|nr:hypothetical protein PoB_006660100 [Plakobranchus ocellatus]